MKKWLRAVILIAVIIGVIYAGRACIYGGLNAILDTSSLLDPDEPEATQDWSWVFPAETAAPIEALPTEIAGQTPIDGTGAAAGGYYNQLGQLEKQIYNAVRDAVAANKNVCMIPSDAYYSEGSEIERAVDAYLMDHPECLDLNGAYTVFSNGKLELDRYDYWSYSSNPGMYTEKLMARVSEIASEAKQYDTDYDRAVFVHDYICQNCRYDHERLAESEKTFHDPEVEFIYNAYGCLVQGSCVCQGYAEAYKLILDELGIECRFVKGIAEGERHGWNIVKLDGAYCHVDVTWDDSDDFKYGGAVYTGLYDHTYFGLTSERISVNHTPDTDMFRVPECVDTSCEYYSHMGYLPETDDAGGVAACAQKQHDAGAYPVVIRFADKQRFEECASDRAVEKLYGRLSFNFIFMTDEDMLTLTLIEKKAG